MHMPVHVWVVHLLRAYHHSEVAGAASLSALAGCGLLEADQALYRVAARAAGTDR